MKDKKSKPVAEEPMAVEAREQTDRLWYVSSALIVAIAAFLRFFWLALKPLHHDEGVNGFFLTTLFRDGTYKYDPANYHGPTLYYIALGFAKIFGLETVPIRASVATFGVLTVILVLYLKRYIGKTGSLFAALFVALSPGMVFISRYFIHEIFFIFLSIAMALSIALFIERRKAGIFSIIWVAIILLVCFLPSTLKLAEAMGGENTTAMWGLRAGFFVIESVLVFFVIKMILAWNDGRAVYFLLASACAALLFATKETAFITIGTMLIAWACVAVWRKIYDPGKGEELEDEIDDSALTWANFKSAIGTGSDRLLLIIGALAVFVYLFVLFFSSFFTYPEGLKAAFEAYSLWTKTGSKDHTQNGLWAYVSWGLKIEAPILILSAIGAIVALTRPKHRFALFTAFWAFGMLAAYSLIPYKTPWLALSFLLPMCIAAGYGIGQFAAGKSNLSRFAAIGLGIAAASILAYQTYSLNFVRYDDDRMPYVYAHTRREFLDLLKEIDHYAEKGGKGNDATIQVISPDYWPMVWYMKDYPHAYFHGHAVNADGAEMIVAKKDDQDDEVIRRYSAQYEYVGSWPLRPGVDLMLLIRKDLADDGLELYKIEKRAK